jgi:16S rRNA (uracil1498-N3)-methyltransferase
MTKALKRFLVTSSLKQRKASVFLTPQETHHLKDVLHMKEGNQCLLFDREGSEYIGQVESFKKDGTAEVKVIEPVLQNRLEGLSLSVAQAIPQDRKMDDMVRKSAELGLYELIPIETERTIVRMKEASFKKARERWNRILLQASKQARHFRLPQIKSLTSFDQLCSQFFQYDDVFLLHPSKEAKLIRECRAKSKKVLLMIGPEGGFSEKEANQAHEKGAQLISMGTEIMRIDTAFVAAASFFKFMGTS